MGEKGSQSKAAALIYLTYNSENHVRENLPDLIRSGGQTFDICAIDNGSEDYTVPNLWAMGICPLIHDENLGFTAAINEGIDWALHGNAEWILIVNPDVKPITRNWVARLLDVPPECGIVGAKLMKNYLIHHSGGMILPQAYPFLWTRSYPFGDRLLWAQEAVGLSRTMHRSGFVTQYLTPERMPWVTFAVVGIRRQVIEDIGSLDNRFWLYCSDTEYCLRALTSGWQVWYNPVEFSHECGGSLRSAPQSVHDRGQRDIMQWLSEEPKWLQKVGDSHSHGA